MGTDIHGIIRVKTKYDVKTFGVPPRFLHRDYDFFAILAGVRNGHGFGGSVRYEKPVTPFTSERGFPKDYMPYTQDGGLYFSPETWAGCHDFGYITLKELRDNIDLANQTVIRHGIFGLKEFFDFKEKRETNYCLGVSGKGVQILDSHLVTPFDSAKEAEKIYKKNSHRYVKHTWEDKPFIDKMSKLINYLTFFEEAGWVVAEDIQFIFGFDS